MLVRGGKARVLRRFTNGDYVYTALGNKYFEKHDTQYLVHVTAIIKKGGNSSQGHSFPVPHNAFVGELTVPNTASTA